MAQAEKRECTSSGRAAATPHASAPPQLTGYANQRAGAAKTAEALLLRRRRYTSTKAPGQPVAASMTTFTEPKKRAATAARVGAHGASAGDEDLQLPRRPRQRVSAGGAFGSRDQGCVLHEGSGARQAGASTVPAGLQTPAAAAGACTRSSQLIANLL